MEPRTQDAEVAPHDPQPTPPDSLAERVAAERHPRWRVLRRGRALLVGYALALLVVTLLAVAARTTSVLPGDLPFTREFQEQRPPVLFGLLYVISYIGYPVASGVIVAAVAVVLWLLKLRLEALFAAGTLLASLLGALLKVAVARQRPSPDLVSVAQHLTTYSFPSGHTLHYTVFYGFLLFVVLGHFRSSPWRLIAAALCLGLIVLIGPSRVYLGAHWLTDVVAGYLIGALFLVPYLALYLWVKQRYDLNARPPFFVRRAAA